MAPLGRHDEEGCDQRQIDEHEKEIGRLSVHARDDEEQEREGEGVDERYAERVFATRDPPIGAKEKGNERVEVDGAHG